MTFPFFLMGLEPFALIVALESRQKLKKVGSEVNGHSRYVKKGRRKSQSFVAGKRSAI